MFRQRHRRQPPFADFINWTDYRWEPGARRGATAPRAQGRHAASGRRYSFLQVFLAGLAVVAGLKLMSALQGSACAPQNGAARNRGNRSWLERGVLTVLLLILASYVSRHRRPL